MKINFLVIDHHEQRYETCGDYWRDGDTWEFRVSRMSDVRYHWLVFLHELIEATLLHLMGIPWSCVDKFDRDYEDAREAKQTRAPCGCRMQEEPGDDRHAPYRRQHQVATLAERAMARLLGVRWAEYNRAIEAL